MVANYNMSINTKAILNTDSAYYKSLIYEGNKMWNHVHSAEYILGHNCILNGSPISGRRAYAKKILRSPVKLPIPVIPQMNIYMVPTSSPKSLKCAWIAYYHVEGYEQCSEKTYIQFRDGTGIYVDGFESTFHNQMVRAGQLIAQINRPVHY